jgi:type III secretion protein J
MHSLSETDANRLLTRLHLMQIDSRKVKQPDGKWLVDVPKSEMLKAIRYLDEARMLRDIQPLRAANSAMFANREDQHFEFERVLSREVEGTLASIEGVLEARVHLKLPRPDPFFGEQNAREGEGSASVLLIAGSAFSLSKEEIQALVSGASGMPPSRISIVLSQTRSPSDRRLPQDGPPQQGRGDQGAGEAAPPAEISRFFGAGAVSGGLGELSRADIVSSPQAAMSLIIVGIGVLSWLFSWHCGRARRSRKLEHLFEKEAAR